MTWQPPADLDPEVLALCQAINELPGLMTVESCCGHGSQPFRIWVHAAGLDALPPLAYYLDLCHSGQQGWQLIVHTDCGMSPAVFVVEGPPGGYPAADEIAGLIAGHAAEEGDGSNAPAPVRPGLAL